MTKVLQRADFSGKTIYVGMDVHLKSWNISVYHEQQLLRSFQQPPQPKVLATWLKDNYPNATYNCAYEAGFCGFWIQRELQQQGVHCMVVNAADVPQTDKGMRSKNDRNDARRIGAALQGGLLRGIYVPDTAIESDRRVVRYRQQLQRDLTRARTRIKSLLHQTGMHIPGHFQNANWSRLFVQWLKDLPLEHTSLRLTLNRMIAQEEQLRSEILPLNKTLRQLLQTERYQQAGALLLSIPGIGPITTITLLVEIDRIDRFSSFTQFNSFIGLCPSEHSSGEREHKGRITQRHHQALRSLMIEAAWVAIKHDPALTLAFNNLKKRMTAKRAIIRIARKLLNRLWHVWHKKEAYEKGIVA